MAFLDLLRGCARLPTGECPSLTSSSPAKAQPHLGAACRWDWDCGALRHGICPALLALPMSVTPRVVSVFARLTGPQWLISGGGIVLLIFILVLNCCFKNKRWRAVQEARSGFVSAEFLTLRDLPKHAYELIAEEAERERRTKVVPAWKDDCGWGTPGTEYEGVHFKTFIGSSIRILEAHALKRDPSLTAVKANAPPADDFSRSSLACDVEEYLARIQLALDRKLDTDLCRQYLAFYRNARTAGRECTEQEYRSFLGVFQEILRRVEK